MEVYNPLQQQDYLNDLNNMYQGSKPVSQNQSFMKFLFDFKKEVISPLRHIWRGFEYDDSRREWIKPVTSYPLMNEKGITWSISYIESFINGVFVVSNYNEKFFNFNMREVCRVVWNTLSLRWREFEMAKSDIPRVATEIESKIQAILLGAKDNGFRDFFTKQYHVSESINNQEQSKKSSILSSMGSMFKPKQQQWP